MTDEFDRRREAEYRETWAYLKHSEEVRYRAVRWYFVVAAALLTAAYTGRLQLVHADFFRPVILLFLTVYSAALVAFLADHKVPYRRYVDRLRAIEETERGPRDEGDGAFSSYLRIPGLGGAVVFGAFAAEITRTLREAGSFETPDVVAAILVGVVFLGWVRYRIRRILRGDAKTGGALDRMRRRLCLYCCPDDLLR